MVIVAFDVDLTLINDKDEPKYKVIQDFLRWQELGCITIIWSGSGVDYATRWAQKLGLHPTFILEKCSVDVDIAYDDMMDQENWGNAHRCKVVIKV
jgi:hypothetical protein